MLDVPTLFEKNPRTKTVTNEYIPMNAANFHEWVAMERMPGADIRTTVRRGEVVRLEVVNKPSGEQRDRGIIVPWYRDCVDKGADHWLYDAAHNTDFSNVPDGEWSGEAVGEKIMHNPLNLEGHTILLSSLFPWQDNRSGLPVPPALGRTPFQYDDLRYWLSQTESTYSATVAVPIDGVVWWWHDAPIAQIRARDYGKTISQPPGEALV